VLPLPEDFPDPVAEADPDPVIENVVVPPPEFDAEPVAVAEPDPVAVADAVLLLSCRRTMMESSSGSHLGHIGHAAAYAERYRRRIEYNWKDREARIVKLSVC